jgi:hypothetical protein
MFRCILAVIAFALLAAACATPQLGQINFDQQDRVEVHRERDQQLLNPAKRLASHAP